LSHLYDGRLPVTTIWSGPVTGRIDRVYDADLRLHTLRINGMHDVGFAYDADGYLTNAGLCRIERDAGQRTPEGICARDFTDAYEYSTRGQPIRHTASFRGTVVADFRYARDPLKRIIEKQETSRARPPRGVHLRPAGRLTEVRREGLLTARYGYDAQWQPRAGAAVHAGGFLHDHGHLRCGRPLRTLTTDTPAASVRFAHSAHGDVTNRTANGASAGVRLRSAGNLRQAALPDGRRVGVPD